MVSPADGINKLRVQSEVFTEDVRRPSTNDSRLYFIKLGPLVEHGADKYFLWVHIKWIFLLKVHIRNIAKSLPARFGLREINVRIIWLELSRTVWGSHSFKCIQDSRLSRVSHRGIIHMLCWMLKVDDLNGFQKSAFGYSCNNPLIV